MQLGIDHIFIFSGNNGVESNALVDFGLVEGSSRIHVGQGTRNRKFYFENFFLEILWVENWQEIAQSPVKETMLESRANFEKNGASRFGLCLMNAQETNQLFENAHQYQPGYFPEGKVIEIITNAEFLSFPWSFRLPYFGERKISMEPTKHGNGIRQLTKVVFVVKDENEQFIHSMKAAVGTLVNFEIGTSPSIVLEFDHKQQGKTYHNKELSLLIRY